MKKNAIHFSTNFIKITVEKGSFEDYLNTPKANGYRGIHTVIILKDGTKIHAQIRTEEMDTYAHLGIIVNMRANKQTLIPVAALPWIRPLEYVIESTKGNSLAFIAGLEKDVFQESVIVHGPKDTVYLVPESASLIDVAFFALGEKALRLTNILVKGEPTPFFTKVYHGIHVSFNFGSKITLDYQWLYWCETILAKSIIIDALKARKNHEKVQAGIELLETSLLRRNLVSLYSIPQKEI